MTKNNIKEQLPHLPQSRVTELETITNQITATNKADIIILFGSYARGDYKEKRGETQRNFWH